MAMCKSAYLHEIDWPMKYVHSSLVKRWKKTVTTLNFNKQCPYPEGLLQSDGALIVSATFLCQGTSTLKRQSYLFQSTHVQQHGCYLLIKKHMTVIFKTGFVLPVKWEGQDILPQWWPSDPNMATCQVNYHGARRNMKTDRLNSKQEH
jgi:hypothetical protein